jgi:hypothetical protein
MGIANPLNEYPCWRERLFKRFRGFAVKGFRYRIRSGNEMLIGGKKPRLPFVHPEFRLEVAAGGFQIDPHQPGANFTYGKDGRNQADEVRYRKGDG